LQTLNDQRATARGAAQKAQAFSGIRKTGKKPPQKAVAAAYQQIKAQRAKQSGPYDATCDVLRSISATI